MRSVCVFAGSSSGADEEYARAAQQLGKEIATKGYTLVYGGASVGLMGSVADSALSAGGDVIGILPKALADLEIAHTGLTELRVVEGMHARKMAMADASDSFIALPGGLGTIEESFEVWTWTQLGVHSKAIGFLNVLGYFDSLFDFLDRSVSAGFLKPRHRELAIVSDHPTSLLDGLATADLKYEPKWIDLPER